MPLETDPFVPDDPLATTPCALLARAHDAQLAGTAPVATGWVLIEQPGAWGRKALTSSALEPALGSHLADAAGDRVRVQLIRRPGGPLTTGTSSRTVVLAHTGPTPWAERLELSGDAQLWELEPALAAAPTPPGLGTPVDGPLWLVCTHGKRDRCCAEHGRPIAEALAARHGQAVWETSHVGGHRFAGNLVSLPGGEVYGLLGVAEAVHAVELQTQGRYDVAHLRGHSGRPRPVQAAEILVRIELDVDRRDAVTVGEADGNGSDGSVTVHLGVAGRTYEATVRREPTGASYAQSCDTDETEDPGRWVLTALAPR